MAHSALAQLSRDPSVSLSAGATACSSLAQALIPKASRLPLHGWSELALSRRAEAMPLGRRPKLGSVRLASNRAQ